MKIPQISTQRRIYLKNAAYEKALGIQINRRKLKLIVSYPSLAGKEAPTKRQLAAYRVIANHPDGCTSREVHKALGITRQAAVCEMQKLYELGYVLQDKIIEENKTRLIYFDALSHATAEGK